MTDLLAGSVFAPIAHGTLLVSASTALARLGAPAGTTDLQLSASMGVCAVLLVLAVGSTRQRPARYFLRGLWPGTAAQLAGHGRAMEVQR